MMNSILRPFVCAVVTMAFVNEGYAQKTIGPDAGAKARGEVTSSIVNQRYAHEHARIMYYMQQVTPTAAPEIVKKQADTAKAALAKSDESLKAVKEIHASDPEVVKLVDSILQHHAAAAVQCTMAGDCAMKGDGSEKVADCCVDMHEELEMAAKDMTALKKHLKIDELPVPKKSVTK